ncbi:MAG: response regulator [Syntrophaceae bacterium]|nr:response regulator [Syntrophaceae bacterium]
MESKVNPERPAYILVVDDQVENFEILSDMLDSRSHTVRAVNSGKLAVDIAERDPPDLVLLDVMMPEMDGFAVCRLFKKHPALSHIPIIFISGLNDTSNKIAGFQAGGVDYITKPFHVEEVLARVETHLVLQRMQRELERYNLYLEDLVREKVQEISNSQLATILALSKLAESRDDVTGQHIERTRNFCKIIAEELRQTYRYAEEVSESFVETIFHAAPLHDIGKVGVPDGFLLKADRLTTEEFEVLKSHALIGARTLQTVHDQYPQNAIITMGISLARSHHEKWNGSGYPDGLRGEDIPLSARIMAVADVYDGLRSKRLYKDALTHEESRRIILEESGTQFDPAVVDAFEAHEAEIADVYQRMADAQLENRQR